MDLLDTHLDLLDTDIAGDYFYLQGVLKTSSRYVFKTSSGRLGGAGLLRWGRVGGVFGACLGGGRMFAGGAFCICMAIQW